MSSIKRVALILACAVLCTSCWRTTVPDLDSEHFVDGEFRNVAPRPDVPIGRLLAMITVEPLASWPDWVENRHAPQLLGPDEGDTVAITFINHASFLVQFRDYNILIDPVFTDRLGPLAGFVKRRRAPGIAFDDLPEIDLVLISHNHYDHLDVPNLKRLAERDDYVLGVPLGDAKWLREEGLKRVHEFDWWQDLTLPASADRAELKFTFTPTQHFSGRTATDRNKSFWGSWMVEYDGFTLYHAGDTGMSPHFAQIADRFPKIDVAMIPIGAYTPRWFMEFVHIDPPQAVQAHQILNPTVSVAMHHDTFQQAFEGFGDAERDLIDARRAAGLTGQDFAIMGAGQTVRFGPVSR